MGLLRLRPFRNAYLIRGLLIWAAMRLMAVYVQITDPGLLVILLILCVVALATWLDARRRGEDLFLANLGVPAHAIALTALILPILLEISLR